VTINMLDPVSDHGQIRLFCSSYYIQPWLDKDMKQENEDSTVQQQSDHTVSTYH